MKYLLVMFLLVGCDARISKFVQLGAPQAITCYSGGTEIYRGKSTGKVLSQGGSDGYYFEDAKTRRIVEVSADCVFVGLPK